LRKRESLTSIAAICIWQNSQTLDDRRFAMKKRVVSILSAAALATATLTMPQPAKADISALWLIPAVLGGMWIAGAARPAYAFQQPAYGFQPGYGFQQPGYGFQAMPVGWGNSCWTERRRIRGVSRLVQVCLR
jgi:hypothetical protein